jgi:hypothetical protein
MEDHKKTFIEEELVKADSIFKQIKLMNMDSEFTMKSFDQRKAEILKLNEEFCKKHPVPVNIAINTGNYSKKCFAKYLEYMCSKPIYSDDSKNVFADVQSTYSALLWKHLEVKAGRRPSMSDYYKLKKSEHDSIVRGLKMVSESQEKADSLKDSIKIDQVDHAKKGLSDLIAQLRDSGVNLSDMKSIEDKLQESGFHVN